MKTKLLLAALALVVSTNVAQANTRLLVNCFWPPKHHVCSERLPAWLGLTAILGENRFFDNKGAAIAAAVVNVSPDVCASFTKRVFQECSARPGSANAT